MNKHKQKEKRKFQSVIFDFDYTLADSSRGAMECINFALKSLNLPIATYNAVCQTIGMPLTETFHTLAGQKDKTKTDKFIQYFIKRADEVMTELCVIYDSVFPVTKSLKQNGLTLGIVSTKFRYRIENILKRENLLDVFDVIIGGEDVSNQKPDPTGLKTAINKLGTSTTNTLYVGDSVIDAQTAKKAKIPFAAVLSGVTKRSKFDKYYVCKVANDLYELSHWLIK